MFQNFLFVKTTRLSCKLLGQTLILFRILIIYAIPVEVLSFLMMVDMLTVLNFWICSFYKFAGWLLWICSFILACKLLGIRLKLYCAYWIHHCNVVHFPLQRLQVWLPNPNWSPFFVLRLDESDPLFTKVSKI